ncbi:putative reverse transcriptase domain-containing protein [Tanacetum coccineum]
MTTANQGMSVEEIERIVAQRVANAIEAIAIYESINQTKQRGNKVAGNASNKRKWEGDHNGSFCQQQNKEQKVFRAHTVRLSNKKDYAINLPLCNKCNFHHIGKCAEKCGNCKRRGHQARDCRIPVPKVKQRSVVSGKKSEVICYGCGGLGHYKSKFQDRVNMYWKGKARGDSSAVTRHHLTPNLKPRSQDTSLAALGQSAIKLARQKSYAEVRHKPVEFQVDNRVMLKKCYADEPLVVPLDGLHIDDKLHFVEEPVGIMDCKVKRLKQIRIPIIKDRWNSRRGPDFTWEREDQFRKKYPHLFTKTAPSASATS